MLFDGLLNLSCVFQLFLSLLVTVGNVEGADLAFLLGVFNFLEEE